MHHIIKYFFDCRDKKKDHLIGACIYLIPVCKSSMSRALKMLIQVFPIAYQRNRPLYHVCHLL